MLQQPYKLIHRTSLTIPPDNPIHLLYLKPRWRCDETPHRVYRTTSRRERRV